MIATEVLTMIGWLIFWAIAALLASFTMSQLVRLAILAIGCMSREYD